LPDHEFADFRRACGVLATRRGALSVALIPQFKDIRLDSAATACFFSPARLV
jgi:hypothetical protein